MEIDEAAALTDAQRANRRVELGLQIKELRSQRAVLYAAEAAAEVREVCPETALVLFEEPQEPGSTATILRLVASDGSVLYDIEDDEEVWAGDLDDTDLVLAQDYLTVALEDDSTVFARGLNDAFLLPVPRR